MKSRYKQGSRLQWWTDTARSSRGDAQQQFYVEKQSWPSSWYNLRSYQSKNLCVDNMGGHKRSSGFPFCLWECNRSNQNQQFRPIAKSGDKYLIQFRSSQAWNGVLEGGPAGPALSRPKNGGSQQWIRFRDIARSRSRRHSGLSDEMSGRFCMWRDKKSAQRKKTPKKMAQIGIFSIFRRPFRAVCV